MDRSANETGSIRYIDRGRFASRILSALVELLDSSPPTVGCDKTPVCNACTAWGPRKPARTEPMPALPPGVYRAIVSPSNRCRRQAASNEVRLNPTTNKDIPFKIHKNGPHEMMPQTELLNELKEASLERGSRPVPSSRRRFYARFTLLLLLLWRRLQQLDYHHYLLSGDDDDWSARGRLLSPTRTCVR